MIMLPDGPVTRAADVVKMLERHYLPDGRPPGGILAAEIEAPDGTRRADAIWAPWTIAGGAGLVGHEVKVSRSDVLAELADPTKADPWARHCTRWWLVVAHPSLVNGLAVPEAWGIMSPPSGRRTRTMTVLREAPKLKPADTGPGWRRIAAWQHYRLADRIRDLEYKASRHQQDAEWSRRELAERQAAELGRVDHRAALVGRIVMELERHRWTVGEANVEDIVAAVLDVEAHRRVATRARQEIEYLADTARRIAAPMDSIARDLERLAKAEVPA